MAHVTKTISDSTGAPHDIARASCVWGFVASVDVFRTASSWLTDSYIDFLKGCRGASLHCSFDLNREARHGNCSLWRLIPKHHYWDHLLGRAGSQRLNPSNFWTFAEEGFIGRVVSISKAVRAGGLARDSNISKRFLTHFETQVVQH